MSRAQRILLTRSSIDNGVWLELLAQRGIDGIDLPCIQTMVLREAKSDLENHLRACGGLLFSSPRAIRAVTELCPQFDLTSRVVACVGEATAATLRAAGGRVEFLAPEGTAKSLGQTWIDRIEPQVAPFWPRAFDARAELVPLFEAAGLTLESLPIYRTSACTDLDPRLVRGVDAVFFASPSAVDAYFAELLVPTDTAVISIGPSTTDALEHHGVMASREARTRDLDGMLAALKIHLGEPHSQRQPDSPSSR